MKTHCELSLEILSFIISKVQHLESIAPSFNSIDQLYSSGDSSSPEDGRHLFLVYAFTQSGPYVSLERYIDDLDDPQKNFLIAIFWIGRNEYAMTEWEELYKKAHCYSQIRSVGNYLLTMPDLSSYLQSGLNKYLVTLKQPLM